MNLSLGKILGLVLLVLAPAMAKADYSYTFADSSVRSGTYGGSAFSWSLDAVLLF